MKLRNFLFGGACILALTASFAFKAEKKMFYEDRVTYWPADYPWECVEGYLDHNNADCDQLGSGAQCTVYDFYSSGNPYVPAYLYPGGLNQCQYPLYHQF